MHTPLHYSHGDITRPANHELSRMSYRCRPRKRRDVGIRNANRTGKIVGEGSEARAQHQPDLRPQCGLRKQKRSCRFSASKQVRSHRYWPRGGRIRPPHRVRPGSSLKLLLKLSKSSLQPPLHTSPLIRPDKLLASSRDSITRRLIVRARRRAAQFAPTAPRTAPKTITRNKTVFQARAR